MKRARLCGATAAGVAFLMVFNASVAWADIVQVDGDTAKNGNNISYAATAGPSAEACSTRGTPVPGVVTIDYNSNTHFNVGATVTVTLTPSAAATAAGITATGGSGVVPAGWGASVGTFTIAISTTVPTTAANTSGTPYVIDVLASGAGTRTTGSGSTPVLPYTAEDDYTVAVTCPAPLDTASPTGGILINDGALWTNSGNVTVDLSGSDAVGVSRYRVSTSQAGLASAADVAVSPAEASFTRNNVAFSLSASDGNAKQAWLRLCDAATNCADFSDTIGLDSVKPTISANTNGYTPGTLSTSPVTVDFVCADTAGTANSGIATDTVAGATLSSDGENQSVTNTGTCVDNAGNVADSVTVNNIDIDQTAPVITADTNGYTPGTWSNVPVTVDFVCADTAGTANSGIATDTVAGATLSSDGENQSVTNTGTCVDNAGNVADSVTVNNIDIDQTAPVITADTNGYTPGTWSNVPVTVDFVCADTAGTANSGIATDTVAGATLSSDGENQSVTNTGTCVDDTGNVADSVTVNNIDIDQTAPVITADTNGYTPGTWSNVPVTVDFVCADTAGTANSGIATDTVAGATLSSDGENQSVTNTGTCVDNAGNVADSVTVNNIDIDQTAPVITADTNGYTPGTWSNVPVTVDFVCADTAGTANSGIATDTVAGATLSSDGENQSVTNTGTCVDNAGNVADSVTVNNIDIDQTAPVITADTNGYTPGTWSNVPVTVDFVCADTAGTANSGIATDTVAGATLSSDGENQSVTNTGTCVDNAGNVADSVTVNNIDIDQTAPVITDDGFVSGTLGSNGWYTSAVVNSFSASDGSGSGLDAACAAEFPTNASSAANEGNAVTISSGPCSDVAGNTNPGIVSGQYKIDLTNPYGIVWVSAPLTGSYFIGGVPAAPTCTATDDISGIASCVVTGYSTALGTHTLTATATDFAGRTRTAQTTYSVVYRICGWDKTTVKSGATLPVKLYLCDAAGGNLSDSSIVVTATLLTKMDSTASGAVEDSGNANPDNNFRFGATLFPSGGYIFNLSTKSPSPALGAGSTKLSIGTWRLTFTVDGVSYSILFDVK